MRSLTLLADVPHVPSRTAYERLADLASFPRFSDAVRSVVVTDVDGDTAISRWEVSFRAGILRWTEQDTFDPAALHIGFRQLEGDVAVFDGEWTCTDKDAGCEVRFSARVDLGIPTLAEVLEPIAVRALAENTTSILQGLFGADVAVGMLADAAAGGESR